MRRIGTKEASVIPPPQIFLVQATYPTWARTQSWSTEELKCSKRLPTFVVHPARQQFLWEAIAYFLPFRPKPTDAERYRALENSALPLFSERMSLRWAMSVHDAVDGSSTGTSVPWMWGAPTIQRSDPCRRFRQSVSTSPSRSSRFTALMPLARWSFAARCFVPSGQHDA